jgi:SMC interacting uncharacterized protein involved in chromosome segregation
MENKITKDEKSEIVRLNNEYQTLVFSLGELDLKKTDLESKLKDLNEDRLELISDFDSMKQKETDFISRLEQKYGSGTLDIPREIYISS